MSDNILELAKKLKTLSDIGIGGEKENAASFLKRLMDKHHITVEQIEGEKNNWHEFKCNGKWSKLSKDFVSQVISSIMGSDVDVRVKGNKLYAKITDAQ